MLHRNVESIWFATTVLLFNPVLFAFFLIVQADTDNL